MMASGNLGTAKITSIDKRNWKVIGTGTNIPGTTTITYDNTKGYIWAANSPAKFTDSTHTKLMADERNYSFERI